jgi:isoleucyl-tRNA synthetase
MSKSLGNVIAPQEIMNKHGAEILRLWVAAEDYREDVRISDEILSRLVEAYRKLRNTARFLISNLYDFDPDRDAVAPGQLAELDRWILHRTQNLLARCRDAYEKFEFHVVYHALNNFCSVDLSALYLDIVKDRLYCEAPRSKERRSVQTALYQILDCLVHLMAPILSFTAEEIWEHMPKKKGSAQSVFTSPMPLPAHELVDEKLGSKWDAVLKIREDVLKTLEGARNNGNIGHSLDAKVSLYPGLYKTDQFLDALLKDNSTVEWEDILIVSRVALDRSEDPGETSPDALKLLEGAVQPFGPPDESGVRNAKIRYGSSVLGGPIVVSKAAGQKCERCWKYSEDVGKDPRHPTVCARCSRVLGSGVSS